MSNSTVAVTEGSGKNVATYSFSEGATKEIQRVAINLSDGTTGIPAALSASGNFKTAIQEAIPAGTNTIGTVKTRFFSAAASTLTRPANTTVYAANDEVSATSPSSLAATVSDTNDDTVSLERIRVISSDTGFASVQIRVWIYNGATTAGTDNAAFSTAKANYIGTMSGTLRAASDGSVGVLIPDEGSRIVTTPESGAKTVQLRLQVLGAATPSANSTTFTFTVEGYQGRA